MFGVTQTMLIGYSGYRKKVRFIPFAEYTEHCKSLFKRLQRIPLPLLYICKTVLEIHKNKSQLQTHSDLHNCETKSSNKVVVTYTRLTKLLDRYPQFICCA